MIRALLIEDESLLAARLARLLGKVAPEIEIQNQFESVAESVQFLQNHESEIDLIFLDIHLADGKSFEIFNQVEVKTPIIFTTAYDQYALQAFKQTSVDYLLKPIQEDDLAKAVKKFKTIFKKEKTETAPDYLALLQALQPEQKELKERFIVYVGSKIRSVDVGDVEVIYSENKSTFILTKEGKRYDVNYALDKLIIVLDDRQFFRVNRKAILNISSIKEVHQFSKGKLKIDLKNSPGFDVFVSLERMTKFKKWLNR